MMVPRSFTKELDAALDLLLMAAAERGWSGRDLSLKSGIHPNTLHNLVTGKTRSPHFLTLWKMARVLRMGVVIRALANVREQEAAHA
jgi:transcriptional regulator with XRE-family HTH domain